MILESFFHLIPGMKIVSFLEFDKDKHKSESK